MSTDLVGATPFGETGWAEDHGVTDGRPVVVDDDQQVPFSCTVVIVMYNSADVVAGCLRSLPSALWGLDSVEVIVVDNLSTDDGVAVAERASVHVASGVDAARFSVVSLPDNRGYAAAINAGIAAAQPSDTVLVLNPDIRLEPGSVVQLLGGLEHPGTGIVVPRLLDGDGVCQPSLRRRPTAGRALAEAVLGGPRASAVGQWGETITDAGRYESAGTADWATGAAMLISRQCLDDVGPLDESFFLYSEETDFMLCAGDAGYETRLVPEAVATHLGGELERSPELWSLRAVNRVRLQRRRAGRTATLGFLAASVLGEGVRAGAGRATSRQAVADLVRRGPGIVLRRPAARQPAVPARQMLYEAESVIDAPVAAPVLLEPR